MSTRNCPFVRSARIRLADAPPLPTETTVLMPNFSSKNAATGRRERPDEVLKDRDRFPSSWAASMRASQSASAWAAASSVGVGSACEGAVAVGAGVAVGSAPQAARTSATDTAITVSNPHRLLII